MRCSPIARSRSPARGRPPAARADALAGSAHEAEPAGIGVGQEFVDAGPAREVAHRAAPAADRSRSAPRARPAGRRVTRATRGRLHRDDARVRQRVDLAAPAARCAKNSALWPTPVRSPRRRTPCARSSASTAACCARYCETHSASARRDTSWPARIADQHQRVGAATQRRAQRAQAAPRRARAPRAGRTSRLRRAGRARSADRRCATASPRGRRVRRCA